MKHDNRGGAALVALMYGLGLGLGVLLLYMFINSSPQAGTADPGDDSPTTQSDLVVTGIEISPRVPKAGHPFSLRIRIRNQGNAPSGEFLVQIHIRDVGRKSTYPVGSFRQKPLRPGEEIVAYTSERRMVNDFGFHRVHAEIRPLDSRAENSGKSSAAFGFAVK